jgi:hypothetical protein
MKHIPILSILSICLLQGCSSTSYVGAGREIEPRAMQHILNGKRVEVDLYSGGMLYGSVIRTSDDSLWLDAGNEEWAIANRSIEKIRISSSGYGVIEGALIGGVTLGVICDVETTPSSSGGMIELTKRGAAVLGSLFGMGAGAIVGSILDPELSYRYPPWDATSVVSGGGSLRDTLNVTLDEFLVDGPTYFVGRIAGREYRFEKAEATYSWKRTASGLSITVTGRRAMFLRLGVPGPP